MKFRKLSDWIMIEHCAVRIVKDGDVNKISDRVAFIEKTPRVKIHSPNSTLDSHSISINVDENEETGCGATHPNYFIGKRCVWMYGYKGSSEYGRDENSRQWCDELLKAIGWEVEED